MYRFQVSIHAKPPAATPGPTIYLQDRQIATLEVPRESLATPMSVSFETAMSALNQLPRLFIEPDGSFFWGSPQTGLQWRLDGNLFDRNGRLLFVDLKGTCPSRELESIFTALGWSQAPLMFQLTREAVFLDESQFRAWAAVPTTTGR